MSRKRSSSVGHVGGALSKRVRFTDDSQDTELPNTEEVGGRAFRNLLTHLTFRPKRFCQDLAVFLQSMRLQVQVALGRILKRHLNIKYWFAVDLTYEKINHAEDQVARDVKAVLNSGAIALLRLPEFENCWVETCDRILNKSANFIRETSGLVVKQINAGHLGVSIFSPLRVGSRFCELPEFLKRKKAIVNVKNRDNRCFGYSVLACLCSDLPGFGVHAERPQKYEQYFERFGLDTVQYPVLLEDIPEIEQRLKLNVNVFTFFDDEGRGRIPQYLGKNVAEDAREIDLIHWNNHYAWIKSFSRLMSDVNKHEHQRHFCRRCLSGFRSSESLTVHLRYCRGIADVTTVYTMPKENSTMQFRNVRYQQSVPFVVYADFECLLQDNAPPETLDTGADHSYSISYQKHIPCSVGLVLVSKIPSVHYPCRTYVGEDACQWFLEELFVIQDICTKYLFCNERLIFTDADQMLFDSAIQCYLCRREFEPGSPNRKVRDHDHITGKYRGAAHQKCNLHLRSTYKIPVFFHNFRGYDSHLIMTAIGKYKVEIGVIGQSMEKYLTVSWGKHIVFKDSYQFLTCSLEGLASNLLKDGSDKFVQLRNHNPRLSNDKFELLLRKGVYPYDYMDKFERFQEQQLPQKSAFNNRLRDVECTDDDYALAKKVWEEFQCKTLKDYHDIYLKTDVLLLADVFEAFRNVAFWNYGVDPAHYVSAPHLAWDAMFKLTWKTVDLVSDAAMFYMLDGQLRGGICTISKRYARANNRYMKDEYDPSKPSTYIVYLDANNLYGWAMSQYMPDGGLEWLDSDEWERIDWMLQTPQQEVGYFVECDLQYPPDLHDLHNDYPLAPERMWIEADMLSETQIRIRRGYDMHNAAAQPKLVPNLMDKERYCCHYLNLQFYLQHGLVLTKIHRVIRFHQTPWIEPYIVKNQELRAAAKDEFEKNLFKTMNNVVYGKTVENMKKRSDIKLFTDREKCNNAVNKPQCKGFRIFYEDLAAVDLKKAVSLINKPFYIGFAVLELSKLHMYRFHYEYMLPKYGYDNLHLLFTDTDSLMYEVFCDDVYQDMSNDGERFDFAGYPRTSEFYDAANNKVIGKFKDETSGSPIVEFVGLRPKMYSYIVSTDGGDDTVHHVEKHRAKGVKRHAAMKLRHSNYLEQLHEPHENYLKNRRIASKYHRIYTDEINKRGLCAFDDKRFILEDNINTLAYGHQLIPVLENSVSGEDTGIFDEDVVVVDYATGNNYSLIGHGAEVDYLTGQGDPETAEEDLRIFELTSGHAMMTRRLRNTI